MRDVAALAEGVEAAMRAQRPRIVGAFQEIAATPRFKADGSAVTDMDLVLEETLAPALLALDPSLGLVSEEGGELRSGNPRWYLDPLDGSANFACRIGVFGSQVALLDGTRPLFAAIYEPLTDDFMWAAEGAGAWRQGRRVRMAERRPEEALIYVGISRSGMLADEPELLVRLRKSCYRVRALGSIAVHLRDVASGAAGGYLGSRVRPSPLHDVAPGVLLIREAGGMASDGAGGDPLEDRRTLVAGPREIHDWLCGLLGR